MSYKPGVIFDFDGVIHEYVSKWSDATIVPDGPVPGAIQAMYDFALAGFQVHVLSSRSHVPGGRPAMIEAIQRWTDQAFAAKEVDFNAAILLPYLSFPMEKPPALMTIDDRGFRFEGTFPTPEEVRAFVPWNRR